MNLRVIDNDGDIMEWSGDSSWSNVSSAKKAIVRGIKAGHGQSYLPWEITDISDDDNSLDLELALEVADFFRIENTRTKQIIEEIKKSVTTWQSVASKHGLSRREQEFLSGAFV